MSKYLHVTWNEIEQSCLSIYARMCQDKYKPEIILGVLKGGVIPASIFVDLFGIPMKFVTLGAKSYINIKEQKEVEFFPANPYKYLENTAGLKKDSKILIVDDIWDSGKTINAILNILNGNFNIKVATIFARSNKENSVITNEVKAYPDYFDKIVCDEWVVFSWERYEFMREINGEKKHE
jgi:hypothetical protein